MMELIETNEPIVKCDGGAGILGHPVIYLNLEKEDRVTCPYCRRCFVKVEGKKINKAPQAKL